jgi:hypothetical protein
MLYNTQNHGVCGHENEISISALVYYIVQQNVCIPESCHLLGFIAV